MGFQVLTSLFLGTSVGKILSSFLTPKLPFKLIDISIPGVSENLTKLKTYDLVEFALTFVSIFFIFLFNYSISRYLKIDDLKRSLADIFYFVVSIIVFLQVHFVTTSGTFVLMLIAFATIIHHLTKKRGVKIENVSLTTLTNGFFTGFTLLLITNSLTTNFALPFILLFSTPLFYLAKKRSDFTKHPAHLILVFSATNPLNIFFLVTLLVITITVSRLKPPESFQILAKKYLYPSLVIFLIVYNPLYFAGNLDTIEEGFWLGWLQSMISGKKIYRDFAVYHSPLIPWCLYAFTSIFGYTVKNFRLFLHILEILGYVLIYFSIQKLLKSRLAKIVSLIFVFGITATAVKNNVEIRLGLGLLSLIIFNSYFQKAKNKYLYLSGSIAAISFLVSIEVGLAAIITLIFAAFLLTKPRVTNGLKTLVGFVIGGSPAFLYLLSTDGLSGFFDQIFFYAVAFSGGYFNIVLERAIQTSFFRWHLVWQYLSSTAFYFEFSRLILIGTILFLFYLVIEKSKSWHKPNLKVLTNTDKHALLIALFSLFLTRSVLGRSDYHHVLFVVIMSIPLSFYLIERFTNNNKTYTFILSFLTIFVFAGTKINETFFTNKLFTLSTYGEVVEKYKVYKTNRSDILVGVEVNQNETNKVIKKISEEVSEEETVFIYPWNPEIYFLTNRKNATSFDTPYAFWSEKYQLQMIKELKENKPKLVVVNPGSQFGQLDMNSLPMINEYIQNNFSEKEQIYSYRILEAN